MNKKITNQEADTLKSLVQEESTITSELSQKSLKMYIQIEAIKKEFDDAYELAQLRNKDLTSRKQQFLNSLNNKYKVEDVLYNFDTREIIKKTPDGAT